MENKVIEQYKGFLKTFPLWEGQGPFGIEQFTSPPIFVFPEEKEILKQVPSLYRNFIMGKRMESFFSYQIKSSSDYNLIVENLQISHNKITIGEIDFIIEDKSENDVIHIEMVYKFYVYDPSFNNEKERWIGPNRKDNLLRKIKKLKEDQFPLIYKEETKQVLSSLKIDYSILKQNVCFKANLFVPREMKDKNFPLVNNSCICGYWIHFDEFNSPEYLNNLFYAPKKPDWPIDPEANQEWFSFSVIHEQVKELHLTRKSPLIWMKASNGNVERFFVVWW